MPPAPEIIGHRGFSARAPENTLASLTAAVEASAPAVEFDVQTAACGTPVVIHDEMLGRTTNGVGPVRRRPVTQLKALDAGSWFSAEFAGEAIPTLEEALALLSGRVGGVYQDIKGYREMEDLDRMVEITRRSGMDSGTTFLSGDWVILNRLRQVAPEIRRGYVVGSAEGFPEALDRSIIDEGALLDLGADLVSGNPGLVEEALTAGVEVGVWTVDNAEDATAAWRMGITCITTNEVESLLVWSRGLG
ncbi:glycerophosphodiester phosphodiesterase [Gemmatimonadota bacterium]